VQALHAQAGEVLAIGSPLADLEPMGAAEDAGTVVGTLPSARSVEQAPQAAPSTVKAAPAVRALAARMQVSLEGLRGSGPGGSISRADVEDAAAREGGAQGTLEPLRGVRRAMSRNMARAHAQVVSATLSEVADIHDWHGDPEITLRLVRAICAACSEEPALNAWYLGMQEGRRLNPRVDLGIAMDTPDGLFVPVLRDAAGRDVPALRAGLERMKADVRARTVPRAELRDATITLSNFGMFGGLHAVLVVLPPQVAIVGVGRVHEQALPVHGQVAIRRALPLSLSFDHRAVVGAEAARFMAAMVCDLTCAV